MANKTVQLTNDDGDNLYPLAGGMAADSITTAMLQDDAVTSDKIADEAVTSQNIDWTTFLPYVACSWVGGNQQTSTFKITVTGQQYLSLHGILCLRQTTPRLISIIMGANGISNIYFNDQTGITYSVSGNVVTINYPGIAWSDCGLIYLKIPGSPGIEATVGR